MRRMLVILIVIVLASGALSASEKALLFRFKGIGVDEELIDAVTLIFQGALEQGGKYLPVTAYEVLGDVECCEVSCAVILAREAGLEKAITGSLTRLGGKIITQVQLIDADTEEIVFSDDGVSLTEDDLDVVLKRLATSLTKGKKMESTAEVGMITEQEFEEVRRRESYFSKGLRVGYLWPFSSMGGAERLLVLDFAYQYDTRDFFLSGRSGLRWGGDLDEDHGRAVDVVLLDAKIGRYFNGGDFSPFVSAGIGIHWVKAEERIEVERGRFEENEDSGTGLALIAGGGFTAFKTYNFQFQLDIDYFIILEKLDVGGYPKGIIFTFCIRKGQKRD